MHAELYSLTADLEVITHLHHVASVLNWDQETYMPPGGVEPRAEQISLVLSLAHGRLTGADFRAKLAALVDLESGEVDTSGLTPAEQRLVHETWRDWKRATSLPIEFVGELARVTSKAQAIWQEAKDENDFSRFAPHLERIIELKKKELDYLGYKDRPYDGLLDNFEPGFNSAQLATLFDNLRPALQGLITRIQRSTGADHQEILTLRYGVSAQWKFGIEVLTAMGYDLRRGRQDRSAHPFTTNFHPDDVRITTHLDATDLTKGLFSSMHEGGHALYEQGMDSSYFGTPLCEPISLGIHESQSRLWENYVGRSRAFWVWWYPRLQKRFPAQLGRISLDDFYSAINTVGPSLIRSDADEVTYNLHIMLRWELERAIFADEVTVNELPARWNAGIKKYLGIEPGTDTEGVLQDIHWSLGAFGYFPTYTLGNIYGRQFYEAAKGQIDDLEGGIAGGDLSALREWLRENIHGLGRVKTAAELVKDLTGGPLSAEPFLRYLEDKYSELYHLPVPHSEA